MVVGRAEMTRCHQEERELGIVDLVRVGTDSVRLAGLTVSNMEAFAMEKVPR